jgi:hypothetical protein
MPIGLNKMVIDVAHLNAPEKELEFLVLPHPMKIEQLSYLNNSALLVEGSNLYSNQSECSFTKT